MGYWWISLFLLLASSSHKSLGNLLHRTGSLLHALLQAGLQGQRTSPWCCPPALFPSAQFSRRSLGTASGSSLVCVAMELSTDWPRGSYRPVREMAVGSWRDRAEGGLQSGAEEEADGAHCVSQLVGATERCKNCQCPQTEPPGLSIYLTPLAPDHELFCSGLWLTCASDFWPQPDDKPLLLTLVLTQLRAGVEAEVPSTGVWEIHLYCGESGGWGLREGSWAVEASGAWLPSFSPFLPRDNQFAPRLKNNGSWQSGEKGSGQEAGPLHRGRRSFDRGKNEK